MKAITEWVIVFYCLIVLALGVSLMKEDAIKDGRVNEQRDMMNNSMYNSTIKKFELLRDESDNSIVKTFYSFWVWFSKGVKYYMMGVYELNNPFIFKINDVVKNVYVMVTIFFVLTLPTIFYTRKWWMFRTSKGGFFV